MNGEAVLLEKKDKQAIRFYAQKNSQTHVDEITGETYKAGDYHFPGMKGIKFFMPIDFMPVEEEQDGEMTERRAPYTTTIGDPAVHDVRVNTTIEDEKYSQELEGTICITPIKKDIVLYLNPVNQTADGQVYASPSQGGWMVTPENTQNEGSFYSNSFTGEGVMKDGEKEKSYFGSVKMNFHVSYRPEKVVFLSMDEESQVMRKQEFAPNQVPEKMVPPEDTAYVIVESHKKDATGTTVISRALYSPEEKVFSILEPREDSFLNTRYVAIQWEEEEASFEKTR